MEKKNSSVAGKIFSFPLYCLLALLLSSSVAPFYFLKGLLDNIVPGSVSSSAIWKTSWMYVIFIGIWIVFFLVVLISKKARPMVHTLGTKPRGNNILMLLLGLILGFGMNFFVAFVAMQSGNITINFDSFQILPFIVVLFAVFIQCGAEEIVDRVFLYQLTARKYKSPLVPIIGTSIFFSLMHIGNPGVTPLALINIVLIGVFYALSVYYFDSVWFCIAHHTAWNFTQNIILGLPNSGQVTDFSVFKLDTATATEGFAYSVKFGVEGTVLSSIVIAVGIIAILVYGKFIAKDKKPINVWAEA